MNYLTFLAARRSSPIDNGNLNRSFPGRPDGGVTAIIADYFMRTLLPHSDLVLDIHSGGKTREFVRRRDRAPRCWPSPRPIR